MTQLTYQHHFIPAADGNVAAHRTLLLLHGTGGDEDSLIEWGRALVPEDNLLSPRGQVLENGMPRFFRRLAEGVFDEEDLYLRAGELAAFVNQAADEYGFDRNNVTALGYSNGANIAAALLLLHPQVLKAAVLIRAMVPLNLKELPSLKGVSVLMASGRHDPLVPIDNAENLSLILRRAGVDVTLNWHDAGHSPEISEIEAIGEWLARS